MTKHTHTGHCQACGRIQAVSHRSSGIIAKHGYTVAGFGFFNGTCCGSDKSPLQIERVLTDKIIVDLEAYAKQEAAWAAALQAGTEHPASCAKLDQFGNYVYEPRVDRYADRKRARVTWDEASEKERTEQVRSSMAMAEGNVRQARGFIKDLTKLIAEIHGTALIPVKHQEKKVVKVGSVLRMWGASWQVLELKPMRASGEGPSLNGQTVAHAVLKRATDGTQIAKPVSRCTRYLTA